MRAVRKLLQLFLNNPPVFVFAVPLPEGRVKAIWRVVLPETRSKMSETASFGRGSVKESHTHQRLTEHRGPARIVKHTAAQISSSWVTYKKSLATVAEGRKDRPCLSSMHISIYLGTL